MFRRKKAGMPEQLSVPPMPNPPMPNPNPDYKPPHISSSHYVDNDECTQECGMLAELRSVQKSIKELDQRKRDLEHQYFPTLYWMMAAMLKIIDRVPNYLIHRSNGVVDRETIEMALQCLRHHLNEKNINSDKFDVDKFCVEVRDYIKKKKKKKCTNNELKVMIEKQSQLKESLGVD